MPVSNTEHAYRLVEQGGLDEMDAFLETLPRHIALYVVGALMMRYVAEYLRFNFEANSALSDGDKERYDGLRVEARLRLDWMEALEGLLLKDITPEEE